MTDEPTLVPVGFLRGILDRLTGITGNYPPDPDDPDYNLNYDAPYNVIHSTEVPSVNPYDPATTEFQVWAPYGDNAWYMPLIITDTDSDAALARATQCVNDPDTSTWYGGCVVAVEYVTFTDENGVHRTNSTHNIVVPPPTP